MTERVYFGTDGIRGKANASPMTAEIALKVGLAAGKLFMSQDDRRHLVVIGKDTRISGYMFEAALEAGLVAAGAGVSAVPASMKMSGASERSFSRMMVRSKMKAVAHSASVALGWARLSEGTGVPDTSMQAFAGVDAIPAAAGHRLAVVGRDRGHHLVLSIVAPGQP